MRTTQPHPPLKPGRGAARPPRRWLPYAGGLAFAAVVAAVLWPAPAPVETARVAPGRLRVTINEEGRTRIRQRYIVSAPVAGQLRRISFKAGAEITSPRTVVAVIDPARPNLLDDRTRAQAEAQRDAAAAQLEHARAQHRFDAGELQRIEKLFRTATASGQELDHARLRETAAARELAAAVAELRRADAGLLEFTNPVPDRPPVELFSPLRGRVLKVFEESSRAVAAGAPLLEIGDPADLEVIIENLSRDGAVIKPGMAVELEQWGGSEPLQAVVRFVEPAAFTKISALGVEEQRVYVVADLLTPASQRGNLGDNFRVEARIITWQSERALKVPNGAIFRRGGLWHAYAIESGRARLRPIKIGRAGETETEVLDGLRDGEAVILYPGDRIRDNLQVKEVKL
ncbi:MAG: efflux RND transporter periplasmic adaptor subunit [Verrucomicrobiota bacterium]